MARWQKLGKLFDPSIHGNDTWMQEFAQAPSTLVFDDFVRVYFSTRPKPNSNRQYVSYSSFVDLDRKDLFKVLRVAQEPILSLGKLGTFDEFGTYPVSVVPHNDGFRAYYAGWTRCESVPFNVAIGVAESKEGKVFDKLGDGPVLSYSPDEPFVLSGPKIRRFEGDPNWYLWYIAGREWILDNGKPEPIYLIRMATSTDGLNWKKESRNLIETKVEHEAQASPDVFYKDGKYHMFYCYRYGKDYRGKAQGYRIGYAHSDDMFNWVRDDENVGIDVSEEGWDAEMISYPHVFELDGEIYMMYLGNQVGKEGFGLAKLEKGSL